MVHAARVSPWLPIWWIRPLRRVKAQQDQISSSRYLQNIPWQVVLEEQKKLTRVMIKVWKASSFVQTCMVRPRVWRNFKTGFRLVAKFHISFHSASSNGFNSISFNLHENTSPFKSTGRRHLLPEGSSCQVNNTQNRIYVLVRTCRKPDAVPSH